MKLTTIILISFQILKMLLPLESLKNAHEGNFGLT